MRNITILEEEWSGLTRLAFAPMRGIFALEELGAAVIGALLRNGLVADEAGLYNVTALGRRVLKANPDPFPTGVRIWLEPRPD